MAPAKRKQTADGAPKAKAQRKQPEVASEEQPALIAEVPPEQKPVLDLLDQAMELDALTSGSRALLQAALPTLFLKPKEERHELENKVTDLFDGVFSAAEAKLTGKVAAVEESLQEVEKSKEAAVHLRDELTEKIKAKHEDAEATSTSLQEQIGCVDSLQKELDGELVKEKKCGVDLQACEADKDRFDAVSKDLQTLFKAEGGDSRAVRARNKDIDRFMETFNELPVDKSLCDGLAAGLKSKPTVRGNFTTAVVEYGEKAIQDHLIALGEKLTACRTSSSEQEAAVAEARAKFEAAVKGKDDLENMVKVKSTEAAELEQQQHDADGAVEASSTKSAMHAEELLALRSRLDNFCALQMSYGQLRDGPAPAPVASQAEESSEVHIEKMAVDAVAITAH